MLLGVSGWQFSQNPSYSIATKRYQCQFKFAVIAVKLNHLLLNHAAYLPPMFVNNHFDCFTHSEMNSSVPMTPPDSANSSLSATSPYFTTSESKARFLTRYSQDMNQLNGPVKDAKDLNQKKVRVFLL